MKNKAKSIIANNICGLPPNWMIVANLVVSVINVTILLVLAYFVKAPLFIHCKAELIIESTIVDVCHKTNAFAYENFSTLSDSIIDVNISSKIYIPSESISKTKVGQIVTLQLISSPYIKFEDMCFRIESINEESVYDNGVELFIGILDVNELICVCENLDDDTLKIQGIGIVEVECSNLMSYLRNNEQFNFLSNANFPLKYK